MPLPLPLPPGAGGGIATAMRGLNALTSDALANQMQAIKNRYAPPQLEADITGQQLKNRYAPLETAIRAQNALAYNNRTGNIGTYLRGIQAMPVAERQAYLADPVNRAQYMQMLKQYSAGVQNPTQQNFLTPELLGQYGLGLGRSQPQQAPPQQEFRPQAPPQQSVNVFGSGNGSNNVPAFGNNPLTDMVRKLQLRQMQMSAQQAPLEAQAASQQMPLQPPQQSPADAFGSSTEAEEAPQAPESPQAVQQAPEEAVQSDLTYPSELTPQKRDLLSSQLQANKNLAGTVASDRAQGAVTLDTFLLDNRDAFSKALKDATKYSHLYGRGKKWLDAIKTKQPEAYANYIFVQDSLLPNLANQIKFMEKMGATNTQLEHAKNIMKELGKLDETPETSIKVINKSVRSLLGLSDSIYKTAEPRFPGTYKRIYNVPTLKGDYIADIREPETISLNGQQYKEIDGKWHRVSRRNR